MDYKIRLVLFDSKLLIDLWCLAAEHAIWIKNRVPTIALSFGSGRLGTSKTLYKAYTEQVPNLEHLKAFSYAAYPILPKGTPSILHIGIDQGIYLLECNRLKPGRYST
jgi:hypothetical protein